MNTILFSEVITKSLVHDASGISDPYHWSWAKTCPNIEVYYPVAKLETVSIKQTWAAQVKYIVALLQDGNAEGKKAAKDTLANMAIAADIAVSMDGALKFISNAINTLSSQRELSAEEQAIHDVAVKYMQG